jgi:DNA-binding winged helix-turn-helix (wHTH) protein
MEPVHFESLYPENAYFDQVNQLLTFIKEGNSCQLLGLPGVGRSNLLGLLPFNKIVRTKHLGENEKWFHFVLTNFSEIRHKSSADAVKFLLLELTDSLGDRKLQEEHEKLQSIVKDTLSLHDEMVLFQGLKRAIDYLSLEKELTVVFLFENFGEYVPSVTPEFFTHLTILRQRAKYRFSVVFALTRPLEQLLDPVTLTDFYSFVSGHAVYMPLTDKPALEFRLSYLQKALGKTLSDKQKETILSLTAGHGKLTRVAAEEILTSNQTLDASSSLAGILNENRAVRSVLYEIWNSLQPQERHALVSGLKNSTGSIDTHIKTFLEHIGILNNDQITIPLFEEFVSYRTHHIPQDKITVNEQTNEIVRGQETISDLLTKAEIRLLKFLIHNTGRVVERNEMIDAVWADLQSKEGVTDQALDQLIFRMRRKIETDPNNPYHLQTVKGRGFKFTP